MPKRDIEPVRRTGIVEAAIIEIGRSGSLEITVGQIARRAGVSSALAHHYFGTKEQLFLSAMRHILTLYGTEVRRRLATARSPDDRLAAIVAASFDDANFRPEIVSAWLNFYVRSRSQPEIARLLSIYRRRLRSNLLHALRAGHVKKPKMRADAIAALIDGLYLHRSLAPGPDSAPNAAALLGDYLSRLPRR